MVGRTIILVQLVHGSSGMPWIWFWKYSELFSHPTFNVTVDNNIYDFRSYALLYIYYHHQHCQKRSISTRRCWSHLPVIKLYPLQGKAEDILRKTYNWQAVAWCVMGVSSSATMLSTNVVPIGNHKSNENVELLVYMSYFIKKYSQTSRG